MARSDTRTIDEWKRLIPERFRRGDNFPAFNNVGELKAILAELPDDLEIDPHEVVVANVIEDMLPPRLRSILTDRQIEDLTLGTDYLPAVRRIAARRWWEHWFRFIFSRFPIPAIWAADIEVPEQRPSTYG